MNQPIAVVISDRTYPWTSYDSLEAMLTAIEFSDLEMFIEYEGRTNKNEWERAPYDG